MGLSYTLLKHSPSDSLSYYLKAIALINIGSNGDVWKEFFNLDGKFLHIQDGT